MRLRYFSTANCTPNNAFVVSGSNRLSGDNLPLITDDNDIFFFFASRVAGTSEEDF